MSEPTRVRLNDQWCDFHWAPYRAGANGVFAAVAIVDAIVNHPMFTLTAERIQRERRCAHHDAANEAMAKIVAMHGKPWCCLLGDSSMDKILANAGGPAKTN